MDGGNVMRLEIDSDQWRPLIKAIVAECLAQLPVADDRVAYTEAESADLLGVAKTTLRDERLRGRIEASKVGRRVFYTRSQLLAYLASRKWEPTDFTF